MTANSIASDHLNQTEKTTMTGSKAAYTGQHNQPLRTTSVVMCKRIFEEGNFKVERPILNNSESKPTAFLLDSIFVSGAYVNYAENFLNLLMREYNVFVAGWDNNLTNGSRYFGKEDYARCVANGIEAVKTYSSRDEIQLLVAFSSGLGIALLASEERPLGFKNLVIVGTPYGFRIPWADYYRNYRLVCDDDLITQGNIIGMIRGTEVDKMFAWMDSKYNSLMGKFTDYDTDYHYHEKAKRESMKGHIIAGFANEHDDDDDNNNNGSRTVGPESYKHVNMPVKAYSDWMDVVRYNILEARNLYFENETIDCAAALHGYKDYLTYGFSSLESFVAKLNLGSKAMSLGSEFGHRELLGIHAARHHEALLNFIRE